jgi:hypothetical protein
VPLLASYVFTQPKKGVGVEEAPPFEPPCAGRGWNEGEPRRKRLILNKLRLPYPSRALPPLNLLTDPYALYRFLFMMWRIAELVFFMPSLER